MLEQVKAVMPELGEAFGLLLATAILVLVRQTTTWIKEWIALQRLHLGAETFVKGEGADVPSTENLTNGVMFLNTRFPDSVKQLGATADKLATIVASKMAPESGDKFQGKPWDKPNLGE